MIDYQEMMRRRGIVDDAVRGLTALLYEMAEAERAKADPERWDEEYAGAAVANCVDRLFCAPEAGMPEPDDRLREAFHKAYAHARPFLEEGVPLPGSLEEGVERRAVALWAARWPELGTWENRDSNDPLRVAILAEATRDERRAVDCETAPEPS